MSLRHDAWIVLCLPGTCWSTIRERKMLSGWRAGCEGTDSWCAQQGRTTNSHRSGRINGVGAHAGHPVHSRMQAECAQDKVAEAQGQPQCACHTIRPGTVISC